MVGVAEKVDDAKLNVSFGDVRKEEIKTTCLETQHRTEDLCVVKNCKQQRRLMRLKGSGVWVDTWRTNGDTMHHALISSTDVKYKVTNSSCFTWNCLYRIYPI